MGGGHDFVSMHSRVVAGGTTQFEQFLRLQASLLSLKEKGGKTSLLSPLMCEMFLALTLVHWLNKSFSQPASSKATPRIASGCRRLGGKGTKMAP